MVLEQKAAMVADRQAIAQVLAIHSRGIDRCDAELLKTAYHEDATVAYGMFEGRAHDFADMVTSSTRNLPTTLHRPSNVWIILEGDRAQSESYVIAYMELPGAEGSTQHLIGGRYLDRFEKRDGVWKLSHRTYVLDWNINQPGTAVWDDFYGAMQRGSNKGDDFSAAFIAQWNSDGNSPARNGTMTTANAEQLIDDILARQALHDLCMAYARGVDRGDGALLHGVFHDDATVSVGVFEGSAHEFAEMMVAPAPERVRTFHSIANEWFDVKGDKAVGESYVIAVSTWRVDGKETDGIVGGRYLDRFERRDGVWKLSHRTFVLDWNINQPTTAIWDNELYGQLKTRGGRAPDDPVYGFWPSKS